MTSMFSKYNVISIVLCLGLTLIHNFPQADGKIKKKIEGVDLYYDPISPPCRAILLTLEALNLELNLKLVSLLKREQHTDEFLKINSLHTVPVLKEGDFILLEGPAIIVYLIQEYGEPADSLLLYPEDTKQQAQVNQRMHFDNGTLYPAFKNQYNSWIFKGIEKTDEKEQVLHNALQFVEKALESSLWVAGKSKTVADFVLVASISNFEINGVELSKYTHINRWLKMCKDELDGYDEANQNGINEVKVILKVYEQKREDALKASTPSE